MSSPVLIRPQKRGIIFFQSVDPNLAGALRAWAALPELFWLTLIAMLFSQRIQNSGASIQNRRTARIILRTFFVYFNLKHTIMSMQCPAIPTLMCSKSA
jgi:hypothetical protein